jgi:hypothetical protein
MLSYVQQVHSTLTQLAPDGDAVRIADKAVAMWRDVDAALSPIIGQRGVAALFKRSLLLTVPALAPLVTAREAVDASSYFDALRGALEQQSCESAIATNGGLLQKFVDLLTSLIGGPLTERLLHSVRDNPSGEGAVKEISS